MYKVLLTVLCLFSLLIFPTAAQSKVAEQPNSQQLVNQNQLIKINTATAAEFSMLNGIGEAKASAIVEYRKTNGNFSSVEQLSEVKGIGEKLIEKNRSQLSL